MNKEAEKKLQGAVTEMLDSLGTNYIVKIMAQTFQCAYKCCNGEKATLERAKSCVHKCTLPLSTAEANIQEEIAKFQNRLGRCFEGCKDAVEDKFNSNNGNAYEHEVKYYECSSKCVDDHLQLLGPIRQRLTDNMKKVSLD